MSLRAERIDKDLDEALYWYGTLQDAKTKEALSEFKKYNLSQTTNRFSGNGEITGMKIITYDKLSEFLRICRLRVDDMFRLINVKVDWPSEDFKHIAALCDKLPAELIKQVAETARKMSPDWHKSEDAQNMFPTHRALYIIRRTLETSDRSSIEIPSLAHAWGDGKMFTTVETKELPEISVFLGVSLRWLMRLDDDILVYAKKPETEAVLEEFSFLSEDAKIDLINSVEDILREYTRPPKNLCKSQ